MQDPLFDYAESVALQRQLAAKDERIAAMQAAAAGMRELRQQQARTIEKQRVQIIELERQVKRLGGAPC